MNKNLKGKPFDKNKCLPGDIILIPYRTKGYCLLEIISLTGLHCVSRYAYSSSGIETKLDLGSKTPNEKGQKISVGDIFSIEIDYLTQIGSFYGDKATPLEEFKPQTVEKVITKEIEVIKYKKITQYAIVLKDVIGYSDTLIDRLYNSYCLAKGRTKEKIIQTHEPIEITADEYAKLTADETTTK